MGELFAESEEQNELVTSFQDVFGDAEDLAKARGEKPPAPAEAPEDNPAGGLLETEETPEPASQRDASQEKAAEEAPAEKPAETEDPAEETAREAAEEGEQLIGGKFKSVDELVKAYEHVEHLAGRAFTERDQALLEMQRLQIEQQQPQPPPEPEPDWDDLIDERPAVAAQEALKRGDQHRLAKALEAWEEMAPGAPQVWIDVQRLQAENRELRAIAQTGSEAANRSRVNEEVAQAYDTMLGRYPDFEEHREGIAQAVAQIARQGGNSGISQTLEHGPLDQKIEILDQLYHAARSRSLGDTEELAKRAAQLHVQETEKAKQEARVASASSSGQAEPSPAEALAKQWDNLQAPLRDGYLVFPNED